MIPVLNEEQNLKPTVETVIKALGSNVESYEIIIVNDGSTDDTLDIARSIEAENPDIHVIDITHRMGIGNAYLQGVRYAKTSYLVFVPGDNTWPYRSLCELFKNLGRADIITSYPTNPEIRPFGRRILSKLYTRMLNALYSHNLNYYNGLTIYPMEYLKTEPMTTTGFGFLAEILLKALHLEMSCIEVALPIDERTAGKSKAVDFKNVIGVMRTILNTFYLLKLSNNYRNITNQETDGKRKSQDNDFQVNKNLNE